MCHEFEERPAKLLLRNAKAWEEEATFTGLLYHWCIFQHDI
jgi:hypothetical protein